MNDDPGIWIPVCPVCKTETITALRGQHRCLDCDRIWDGSERGQVDIFAPPLVIRDETTEDVVLDILARMWNRAMVNGRP